MASLGFTRAHVTLAGVGTRRTRRVATRVEDTAFHVLQTVATLNAVLKLDTCFEIVESYSSESTFDAMKTNFQLESIPAEIFENVDRFWT